MSFSWVDAQGLNFAISIVLRLISGVAQIYVEPNVEYRFLQNVCIQNSTTSFKSLRWSDSSIIIQKLHINILFLYNLLFNTACTNVKSLWKKLRKNIWSQIEPNILDRITIKRVCICICVLCVCVVCITVLLLNRIVLWHMYR